MEAVAGASLQHALAAALLQAGFTRTSYASDDDDDDSDGYGSDAASGEAPAKRRKEGSDAAAASAALAPASSVSASGASSVQRAPEQHEGTLRPSPFRMLQAAVEAFVSKLAMESKRLCESANRTRANEIDVACAYTRLGELGVGRRTRRWALVGCPHPTQPQLTPPP